MPLERLGNHLVKFVHVHLFKRIGIVLTALCFAMWNK